jgi:hypothetical protein
MASIRVVGDLLHARAQYPSSPDGLEKIEEENRARIDVQIAINQNGDSSFESDPIPDPTTNQQAQDTGAPPTEDLTPDDIYQFDEIAPGNTALEDETRQPRFETTGPSESPSAFASDEEASD